MQLQIFSIYDAIAETYGTPFFLHNANLAMRAFSDLANDPNSTIFKNPEDFSLFLLGMYSDQDGKIETLATPKLLSGAKGVLHVD